ncbi:hypothetical protein EVAR_14153_1 [Eumeta japonica]|uniref:Uncharacterized protein n=1 Tax=Eumeta variegata TaxID=151549 RepID=A0A4C1UFA9_EUMVA|nr:hypothetical protein EVAR_14153_1 [Eumeta japonica]
MPLIRSTSRVGCCPRAASRRHGPAPKSRTLGAFRMESPANKLLFEVKTSKGAFSESRMERVQFIQSLYTPFIRANNNVNLTCGNVRCAGGGGAGGAGGWCGARAGDAHSAHSAPAAAPLPRIDLLDQDSGRHLPRPLS